MAPASRDERSLTQVAERGGDGVLPPLAEAELISQSLKDVSREMRKPLLQWSELVNEPVARLKSSFGAWVILTFIVFVLVPVLASGLYLALFASDQYASEMRFAVRGGERGQQEMIGAISGSGTSMRIQDSLIVADYIRGRGMVEELEKSLDLRRMFSVPQADRLFRFNPDRPVERLVKYWWWQVDVALDNMSGIITVIVRAFTPEDALTISKAVIAASEKLVNDLSDRSRRDALKQAQSELALAERLLQDKLRAMRELRDREGLLDAGKESDAMIKLVSDLRLELARLQAEYSTQRQSVAAESPQMKVLEARIRSTRDQIRMMELRQTSAQRPAANAQERPLAESMGQFERLKLEQELAQKHYAESAAMLERARLEVVTQQVYLATFLQPVLAQEALYPKRWWILAAITAICLVLWGAGVGIAVLVKNYAA